MKRPGRRDFLAWLSAGAAFRPGPLAGAEEFPVQFREPPPCADLRALIDPSKDVFRLEARGREVERILASTLLGGDLPQAAGFRGESPMPARYVESDQFLRAEYSDGGESFSKGLERWIAALGTIRRANFNALAGEIVRFDVVSDTDTGIEHRVGRWRMRWQGGRLAGFEPVAETLVRSPSVLFADVTADLFEEAPSVREQLAKGIPYWRSRLDPATGIGVYGNQGVAVGDIDGDGWDELYVCQPGGLPNRLYSRQKDGAWLDMTAEAGVGVLDDTAQALFLDLRNIGFQDLVLLTSAGPLLFLNDGTGRFRHRLNAFRFRNRAIGTFAGMAAADYDRDGNLDLYVCSYLYFQSEDQYRYPAPYHDARNGPPNFLFRNELRSDGEGFFQDVTEESGLDENNDRYSFAAAWCDYDEDGWPELYVANDFGRNNLYKYSDGKFRDIAEGTELHDTGPGTSAAWFDYDRGGRLDLYVTNMWTATGQRVASDPEFGPVRDGVPAREYRGHTKGNSLYRNRGDGSFDYAGAEEGVEMGRWSWSGGGFDFDLDGTPEILVTAGMITHSPEKDLCSFFWRKVVAESPAEAKPATGYETGWNCLHQLLREDYSWNGNEPNVFYVRREGRYRDFSGVSGLDRIADSRAFAVTDFDGDGRPDLFLKSRLGPQLLAFRNESAGERRVLAFDLEGTRSNRDAIGAIVRVETEDGVSAQLLSAGSGYISQHTKRLHFGLGDRRRALSVDVLWPSGTKQRFEGLEAGFRYRIRERDGEVARTPFEAHQAPEPALPRINGHNDPVFEPTWLFDAVPLPESAEEGFLFLTDGALRNPPSTMPFREVDLTAAPADRAAAFAVFRRYLFDYRAGLRLPFGMLVDQFSRVHKIYPRLPPQAELLRDWEVFKDRGRGAVGLSLPFKGRYYGSPRRRHYQMGSAFLQAGYPQLALPYLREAAMYSWSSPRASTNPKALLAVGQIELQAGNLDEAERHLRGAQSLNPNSPQLWNNLGGLAMARDDYLGASEHFDRALELDPDLSYALVNAAQAQARLGNAIEAEKLLRRALDLDASDAEAASKLGLIMAKQGRYGEARALFQQAIEHDRDHAEAINNLAILYIQSGQVRDAIAALRYGIEQAPEVDRFYMTLARAHADLGDYSSSREVLQSLLQRKPEHEAARGALVQLQGR